jgi:hypothetical protein
MSAIPLRKRKRPAKPRETPIMLEILQALAHEPGVNAWRNNTGVLEDRNGRPVTFGLAVGSADIVGIVARVISSDPAWHLYATVGRFVALEVKAPGKRPTDDQARWLELIRSRGGFACVVHSVDEALAAIGRARDPRMRE